MQNMSNAPGINFMDFKFNDFVEAIYKRDPGDPFAFQLEFMDKMEMTELRQLLAYFVVTGAKNLYNKELAQLIPSEIEHLRKYLLSIGYNVKFDVEPRMQKLDPNDPTKETAVNYFMIDFFPANPALDKNNSPEHLI